MSWEDLIDLILNSIQIIGIFIAIIIGLIISKVMELKKEKSEVTDLLDDISNELNTMNEQFDKLKSDNYLFYKKDNIYNIIDAIVKKEDYKFLDNIPYVDIDYQKDFYSYVEEYIYKVVKMYRDNISIDECKITLNALSDSIEEIIVDKIYNWR